jgi:hypothetical protein
MMNHDMKRFGTLLEWLNHSHQPPETQSPFKASAFVSLLSFAFIFWLDGEVVSLLRVWWAELLVYALVPILLSFIILYRSSWHQEMAQGGRTALLAVLSCLILPGALIATGIALALVVLVYSCYFDGFLRFHY